MQFGTWTALITPFKGGIVDQKSLQNIIEEQKSAGIDGLVLLGTTAEAFSLNASERASIIKLVRKSIGFNLGLWVGCGTSSTESTLSNAHQAKQLGADGVMIVTPPYIKPNFAGLNDHISAICEQIQLPIMLYNNPSRCGRSLDADSLLKLCAHKGVVAIKESGGDLQQIAHIMLKKPSHVALLAGDDALIYPILALGAEGVVSVSSNLMPRLVKKLVDALMSSDLKMARRHFARLFPLFQALQEETNPIPIKYLMSQRKLCSAQVRCPLGMIDAHVQKRIDSHLIDQLNGDKP